ncbi:SMP-30/gluconolactonase/LRE family protein [Shewanella livingstonensis]|nr:SMP-30/gluconolactonase/LRE family protein [Shewanella livingstonensis]
MHYNRLMTNGINTCIGELLHIIPSQNELGENALWHPQHQAIYWIDIMRGQLHRYCVSSKEYDTFTLPHRIGSFSFLADSTNFDIIVAFEQGVALYHLGTQALHWVSQPEATVLGNRFNDGRTDRNGNFWAGTMVETQHYDGQYGHLYRIDSHQQCHKILDDILISNGLCWSPDGSIMYHADSERHCINQYHYDEKHHTLSDKTLFATTKTQVFPDGSTVDAQGYMWNAQWGDHSVVRYHPNGKIVEKLILPAVQPSSVAIGGPDLDWLIVTTSRVQLTQQQLIDYPLSGNVFIYQLHKVTGIVDTPCRLNAH